MAESFSKIDGKTVNITLVAPVKTYTLEEMQRELAIANKELVQAQEKVDKWTTRISESAKVGVA